MDSEFPRPIHLVAAHLAVVVAVIHLSMGLLEWFKWLQAGFLLPRDLRWPLFVVSGFAIVFALPLATRERYRRPVYLGGIALMVVYVLGYFGWHLGGHRPLFFLGQGHSHEVALVPFLLDHLFAGPVKFLAIATETALAGVLAYLFVAESDRR